jgi:hypothetical protein
LRKEREAVEARARDLDLEVARRVDGEKQRLAEQQDLRLKEKDKLIEDLRSALEEARRKSEQGSQERQGEVLGIDIEAELARRFPQDAIVPVAKGARGADLVHEVRDRTLRVCGTIVWEMKNTRHWQPAWIDKLKADQRAIGANLAVIVSTALPDSIVAFGRLDSVWAAGLRAWPALAVALREQRSRSPSRMPPPKARARRWSSSTITSRATSSAAASKRRSTPSLRCATD